ncbi:hypothetical protein CPB84DRAFT_1754459 [Gymnopilus junonius]|uniref:Uncharacterized protein n=1 Tax=Gymnopilus junonius TaxID=109634 RepID=A0A9P5TEM4_GYMJU|nr:hypothetical protein CPB84DRAFT_1754459 [Gymnopilus junonius]
MLAITTERLSHETIRANEAERQAAEVLALFKKTHEKKTRMERDLRRAQTELGLYKIQLDVAQKEIFKAQETVDKLERQRVAAEEEAARSRDKVHKLSEARAVEHAMQEARWLGFEEGLKQGRQVQPLGLAGEDVGRQPSHRSRRSEDVSRYSYRDEDVVKSPSTTKLSARHRSSKSYSEYPVRSTKIAPRAAPSTLTRQRRSSSAAPPPVQRTPDVGTYSQLLPRPTITTPMPVEVPATQPQPAPAMPPQQPPNPIHDHSKHPETINVQDPNAPIHPVSIRNMTPSIRHERIVLPPDNYIPTMGPDSHITLPPPHELSQPVAPEAPPGPPPTAPVAPVQQQQPSRPPPSRPRAGDTASIAYTSRSGGVGGAGAGAGMKVERCQQCRLDPHVSPNLTCSAHREKARSTGASTGTHQAYQQSPVPSLAGQVSTAPTAVGTNHPRSVSRRNGGVEQGVSEIRFASREPVIPRPPSSASGRRSRRPREIVLPAPLSEVMINTPSKPTFDLPPASEGVGYLNRLPPSLSDRTTVDPVLLTPDSAMRVTPLPPSEDHDQFDTGLGLYQNPNYNNLGPDGEERISMVLPDNNLPPGFVPLSPINGMNVNPYLLGVSWDYVAAFHVSLSPFQRQG